jgi:hypothetical protein
MGTVFESWGVSEAAIINGKDPKATWSSLVDKVTKAIAKK